MTNRLHIDIDPEIIHNREEIRRRIREKTNAPFEDFEIVRRSVDARRKQPHFTLQVDLIRDGGQGSQPKPSLSWKPVQAGPIVLVVGAGPAGLFAALTLVEQGIRPIVIERGEDVDQRRKDIACLLREGRVNPESNYCYGEGGAGTFSDGKLFTRATKRGDVGQILETFIAHGASEAIRVDAHPHIGSNRLPSIVRRMRTTLLDCGGEIHFQSRVVDFVLREKRITGVMTQRGKTFEADGVILATGHSARDIYALFQEKGLRVLPKAFSVGVRVEHPQARVDRLQYHQEFRHPNLPPAEYRLTSRIEDRGVYSFCMCPGGHIIPASTDAGELVVNGMSNADRNAPFANSGIVVEVRMEDIPEHHPHGPYAFLSFQRQLERRAFRLGGATGQRAPAQRMTDFIQGRVSASLPKSSYLPGIHSASMDEMLPRFLADRLKRAFSVFDAKRRGYVTESALLVGLESRTSAPVTLPRDSQTLMHPDIQGLYPCGEGAGYAGGIVSSALDGRRVALAVSRGLNHG